MPYCLCLFSSAVAFVIILCAGWGRSNDWKWTFSWVTVYYWHAAHGQWFNWRTISKFRKLPNTFKHANKEKTNVCFFCNYSIICSLKSKQSTADGLNSIEMLSERAGMSVNSAIIDLTNVSIVANKLEESFLSSWQCTWWVVLRISKCILPLNILQLSGPCW